MAFYKYFWDLASSTTLADHTVGSFDNNTDTGGGDFKWVSNANNTLITNIPGIRIKPTSTTNGYWIRVMSGPISVDWFGPQNTNNAPYTFAQLGVSQVTLNNRYGVGFVTVNDTYDTAAVKYAVHYMGTLATENSVQFEPKMYWLTQSIDLPTVNITNTGLPGIGGQGKFIIDGNGCTITTYLTGAPFDVFRRIPANQTEADTWINYSIVFKNFSATSTGASWVNSGYSFLFLGASSNAVIDNINLVNYDIGIRLEYCPNATVRNIYTSGVKTRSVYIKAGSWLGSTLTNSNSNNVAVYQMQVEDTNSQVAALSFAGANNAYVSQFWLKGPGTPDYGIWWDSLNNTEAYNIRIMDTYISTATATAGVHIKMQDEGMALIDGLYNSVVHTVLSTEMYSGAGDLYFSNSAVWPAGTQMSNVGTIEWDFKAVNLGTGINTPAEIVDPANSLWVVGPPTIPSVSNVYVQSPGGPIQVGLQAVLDYDRSLVNNRVLIGTDTGSGNAAVDLIAIGTDACKTSIGTPLLAIGGNALKNAAADQVIAIGPSAGENANTVTTSIFLGPSAGLGSQSSQFCVGIGQSALSGNEGSDLVAIGQNACYDNLGDNIVALGTSAGQANEMNNQFIIANTHITTYADHAAASSAITVANGASAGSSYLYHNQGTNSIGVVKVV